MSRTSARGLRQQAILYITYDGILEPLGESQVLQYLRHLASDFRIVLISYEKPADWADRDRTARARALLREAKITWVPLRYHHRPSGPATVYDLAIGLLAASYMVVRERIVLVHVRSYVPAVLGLALKHIFRVRLLFDMRGFWADERVEGGVWRSGSRLYRVAKWFERQFLLNADAVVSLTEAGAQALREFPYLRDRALCVSVIPTCADLEAFAPRANAHGPGREHADSFILGYVGSASLWYRFDLVLESFAVLLELRPQARLRVVNRGQHDYIWEQVAAHGVPMPAVEVRAVDFAAVPAEIQRMDAGIFFVRPTFSKLARAPTKLGEFLGCGVPCLTNAGVGDVDQILEGDRAGIVMHSTEAAAIRAGVERLVALAGDPEIANRCRRAAEKHFNLATGVAAYRRIYAQLLTSDLESPKVPPEELSSS